MEPADDRAGRAVRARRRGRAFGDGVVVHALGASTVLSQGRDGRVRAWDAAWTARCAPILELPAANPCACAPSPALVAAGAPVGGGGGGTAATAATLALPSADANEVVLWDARAGAHAGAVDGPRQGRDVQVRFADDGRLLAGWEDGSPQLFDLRGGGGGGSGGGGAAAAARKLHSQPLLSIDVDLRRDGGERRRRLRALRGVAAGGEVARRRGSTSR